MLPLSLPCKRLLRATTLALLASPALVSGHTTSLGAHVHGVASLQIAIEGHQVDLLFHSPADNLAGFEHAPENEEQKQRVEEVVTWLHQTPLINTVAGDCTIDEVTVEHQLEADEHSHHSGDHGGHEHSEFDVSQRLTCKTAPQRVVSSPLQARFPAIEQLVVDWVSEHGQGQTRLQGAEGRASHPIRLEP